MCLTGSRDSATLEEIGRSKGELIGSVVIGSLIKAGFTSLFYGYKELFVKTQ